MRINYKVANEYLKLEFDSSIKVRSEVIDPEKEALSLSVTRQSLSARAGIGIDSRPVIDRLISRRMLPFITARTGQTEPMSR